MDLSQFIRAIPKAETHLHIEGALPWSFLEKINPSKFSKEPPFRSADFRYDNFEQFESILIEHALEVFASANDYHEVAASIFRSSLSRNVRYIETSFHAGMIEFLKIPGQEIVNAILSAAPAHMEVRVFLGISRNAYTDYLGPRINEAVESWAGLSGIDLHGPEHLPLESWTKPLWLKARRNGLTVKAHAGEFGPASNIDYAIAELGVKRIQHGVAARDSEKLMQKLIDEDICLDMCPISNYKLRVVDDWRDHPLKDFIDRGIMCTISTDDPLSFNNSLIDEYESCINQLNLSVEQLVSLAKNAFRVSNLCPDEQNSFINEIDELMYQFQGNGRKN